MLQSLVSTRICTFTFLIFKMNVFCQRIASQNPSSSLNLISLNINHLYHSWRKGSICLPLVRLDFDSEMCCFSMLCLQLFPCRSPHASTPCLTCTDSCLLISYVFCSECVSGLLDRISCISIFIICDRETTPPIFAWLEMICRQYFQGLNIVCVYS